MEYISDGSLGQIYTPKTGDTPSAGWRLKEGIFDGLGSTRQLTSASQAVTDATSYDGWGNVLSSSGATVNPFKYVGRLGYYADTDNGLMLLGARYYGSGVGRFWTGDPVREGSNWYIYVTNNPVNSADPSGLLDWKRFLACLAILSIETIHIGPALVGIGIGICAILCLPTILLCGVPYIECLGACTIGVVVILGALVLPCIYIVARDYANGKGTCDVGSVINCAIQGFWNRW